MSKNNGTCEMHDMEPKYGPIVIWHSNGESTIEHDWYMECSNCGRVLYEPIDNNNKEKTEMSKKSTKTEPKNSFNAWMLKYGGNWISSLTEEGEVTYNMFATRKEARDYKMALTDWKNQKLTITKVRIEEV